MQFDRNPRRTTKSHLEIEPVSIEVLHKPSSVSFSVNPGEHRGVRAGLLALVVSMCALVSTERATGQLVVANNAGASSEITLIDLSGVNPPRVLVAGIGVDGIAADDANQTLYWFRPRRSSSLPAELWKASYTTSGPLTPVLVGSFPSTPAGTSARFMKGLAFDSVDHQLIGFDSPARVWSIDVNTAAATVLWTWPDYVNAFYGADFDPITNTYIGVAPGSGSNTPEYASKMIRRMSKPLSNPTVATISTFPNGEYGGFSGLAVGNGRVYLIGGSAGPSNFDLGIPAPSVLNVVYNLATNTYESMPIIEIPGLQGATWAPGLLSASPGVDLGLSAGASQKCVVHVKEPGSGSDDGTLVFSVRIDNYGALASGPATLTVNLDTGGGASYSSSTPTPSSVSAGQLVYELPSIPAYGPSGFMNVEIRLTATAPNATVSINASIDCPLDTNTANNTAMATTRIRPNIPATASIKGVFSTNPSFVNSLIPGTAGIRFSDFQDPMASSSGNYWAMTGVFVPPPTIPAGLDFAYITVKSPTGGTPVKVLHQGVTQAPHGALQGFPVATDVDNSGAVLVVGDDEPGSTLTDGFLATTMDGVTYNELAREDGAIPAMPGSVYSSFPYPAQLQDNGTASFCFTTNSDVLFTNNGNNILAQVGVTTPIGASSPIASLRDTGNAVARFDRTGTHSIYAAWLDTGGDADDTIIVADGTVILQEGVTEIPGAGRVFVTGRGMGGSGPWIKMGPDGTFMIYDGYHPDLPDVVMIGSGTAINQVVKTGDPICEGATEHWANANPVGTVWDPSDTFFTYQPGPGNHYVIGGVTDESDGMRNTVLVYDNRVVIARANDPVDLDGNGVFDDHMYIRSFVRTNAVSQFYGGAAFTNDHAILICVTLRDEQSAMCKCNDMMNFRALVRIPLPGCNDADVARLGGTGGADGQLTVDDLVYFLAQFFAGNTAVADIAVLGSTPGHDGQITVDDLVYFLTQFFAGCGS